MLSHHLCGSCLQGLVFMPLLSIQWHSEAAVGSWCLTKWVLDVLTKLWSMYDVLLYEVSFGDIGTCQPHELCPGNHCCCCCCNWCCEDEPNSSTSQQQRDPEQNKTSNSWVGAVGAVAICHQPALAQQHQQHWRAMNWCHAQWTWSIFWLSSILLELFTIWQICTSYIV